LSRFTKASLFFSKYVQALGKFVFKASGEITSATKYLDPENGELRDVERSDHSRALNLINAYCQGGSYNSLAKGLKDTELRILHHFTQNWLSLETINEEPVPSSLQVI
jgi:hypothetical protein